MQIDAKDIGEFQQLWQGQTGEKLDVEQAQAHAEHLLALIQLVVEPEIPRHEEPP